MYLVLGVGVFAESTYLLPPLSLMHGSHLSNGKITYTYAPTAVEWPLMVGAYALGILIFFVLMGIIFDPRR